MGHAPIEQVGFRNPRFPALAVEAMTLAELRSRIPGRHLQYSSRPQFHQLVLIEAGSTPHDVDFVRFNLSPGKVLHVRPGQVQKLVLQSRARGTVILFSPEFVDAVIPEGLLVLPAAERARVTGGFASVLDEYDRTDGTPRDAAVLRHLLSALLLMLARAQPPAPQGPPAEAASRRTYTRFMQELERSFAQARSVAWYAAKLGYSAKTLVRACQDVAGESPKVLIDRRVSLEAKRLLAHATDSVSAIGSEVGFSETTNFVKFFRRQEGLSPAEFRARQATRG